MSDCMRAAFVLVRVRLARDPAYSPTLPKNLLLKWHCTWEEDSIVSVPRVSPGIFDSTRM